MARVYSGEAGSTTRTSNGSGNNISRRRRRRKRASRKGVDASRGHEATTGHDATGPRRFSYTLDISGWPGANGTGSPGMPTSEMGEGVIISKQPIGRRYNQQTQSGSIHVDLMYRDRAICTMYYAKFSLAGLYGRYCCSVHHNPPVNLQFRTAVPFVARTLPEFASDHAISSCNFFSPVAQ